jgi:hypothetical protein
MTILTAAAGIDSGNIDLSISTTADTIPPTTTTATTAATTTTTTTAATDPLPPPRWYERGMAQELMLQDNLFAVNNGNVSASIPTADRIVAAEDPQDPQDPWVPQDPLTSRNVFHPEDLFVGFDPTEEGE